MELIVTQPVFLWLLGIVVVLGLFALLALVIILFQVVKLMHLANEKAANIGATIDEVRETIHKATETVNDTKDRISNFLAFTTSAAGLAKLVASVRDSWAAHHPKAEKDDMFDGEKKK